MKKILLALAVVSMVLPMSAMADNTTIYGQFRYSIADVSDNGALKDGSGAKDGVVAADNTSVLGVKGSYGDDIKAYFHLQMGARADGDGGHDHWYNDDDSGIGGADEDRDTSTSGGGNALAQRFFFGGLKGSFGNVKYGRLTNAYKMPGFKMDPLYNTSHLNVNGQYATGGASYGLSGATNGFTDNSLEYHSPKIAGGLTVNLGYYIDDSDEDDHSTGAGVTYSANGITAGVQTIQNGKTSAVPNTTADEAAMRVHVGYKGEGFKVGVSYETVATATTDPTYLFLTGTFGVAEKTDIVATIGMVDADAVVNTDGTNEGTGFSLSVFHGITNNTKVFASYASVDFDGDQIVEDAPTTISFGVQHKFSTSN